MTILYRSLTRFAPEGTNPGAPAAPSAPAAGTPAPAASPAPSAPAASEEPPAWAKALMSEVAALKGEKKKLEADASAATAAKQTVEEQLKALQTKQAEIESRASQSEVNGALGALAGKTPWASDKHSAPALKAFRGDYKLDVVNGAVIATGPDGKSQHLDQAWSAWTKGEGALFVASPAQPGPGTPGAAPPAGTVERKAIKDMSKDEFAALRKQGVTAKLTNDARSPSITFKDRTVPKLAERREALLGAARGTGPLK